MRQRRKKLDICEFIMNMSKLTYNRCSIYLKRKKGEEEEKKKV